MKRYIKLLVAGAAALSALASCTFDGGKAEYKTASYACFNGTRFNVKETAGQIEIPVVLHSKSSQKAIATYKVTPISAKEGEDYTLVDASGTLEISSDAAQSKGIKINIVSYEGIKTGNKKFKIDLVSISDDAITVGPTTSIEVTILDNEGGLAALLGNWGGTATETSGNPSTWTWEIAEYSPTEDDAYPNANCKILSGFTLVDPVGNSWTGEEDLYCFFNEDTFELNIYVPQCFAGGNFGEDIGVLYVALAPYGFLSSGAAENVKMLLGEDELILQNGPIYFGLFSNPDGTGFSGYTCGNVTNITMTKK